MKIRLGISNINNDAIFNSGSCKLKIGKRQKNVKLSPGTLEQFV